MSDLHLFLKWVGKMSDSPPPTNEPFSETLSTKLKIITLRGIE